MIEPTRFSRRRFLGAAAALAAGAGAVGSWEWHRRRENGLRSEAFIAPAADYSVDLVAPISAALQELGVSRAEIRGKRVLLKPNLVETSIGHAHINTHPAVVIAAAEAFRRLDAAEVLVAEGQGHRRDSWSVLEESGLRPALAGAGLRFRDLNHDDVERLPNRGGWTRLTGLFLPRTLLAADFIVSLPKLKTHHWAGVTCAMKNLFGVMPGIVYGWPKNVLHYQGIPESIADICATVRPHFAIVDGIVGMDGDGPIMGDARPVGCLIAGRSLTAVDATCARLMQLNPARITYLRYAGGRLGPIREQNIAQRGEAVSRFSTPFRLLDLPHLRALRSG